MPVALDLMLFGTNRSSISEVVLEYLYLCISCRFELQVSPYPMWLSRLTVIVFLLLLCIWE